MTDIDHIEDVAYGYKDGMALAMDVYTPGESRVDAGIIVAISGGWGSDLSRRKNLLQDPEGWGILPQCLLDAGYVVFAAAHSTQPRYTIEELRPDLPRAVRFIRHHAESFGIDQAKLGIVGGSSGGHVSLMTALEPPAPPCGTGRARTRVAANGTRPTGRGGVVRSISGPASPSKE